MAAVFAPSIVRYLLAPGFSANQAQFNLTVELLRIQLASVVLFGLGGLLVGVLNAHKIFFIPALTPSMYQLGLIFGVLLLAPRMGVRGLAWGVILGASLYLLLQLPALLGIGRAKGSEGVGSMYTPTFGLRESSVQEVLRLMLPRVLGIGVVQVNFWVNTWLASQMQSGSVAGLQYGFSLMLMAQAAIAQSVAIAAMPTFSAQYALGRLEEFRSSLTAALRGVILLAVPAAAGLMLLRQPIVALLYQRGQFDARMTAVVSWALLWFAAGLVGHSMLEILTRAFYAQHDTRTPVIVGASAMALNVVLSLVFSGMFARAGWMPHGGLALANSVATALETAALYLLMRKRLGAMDDTRIGLGLMQAALGTAALCAVVIPFTTLRSPPWLAALGGVAVGAAAYFVMMRVLKVQEVVAIVSSISKRIRGSR
jgi:putative peptidoglycan lipid II flippase